MIAAMETKVEPRIQTLTIENFRAFRRIEIDGIGRCNLLTGENNTGKSSLLEALRILASNGALHIVNDVLERREERTQTFNGLVEAVFWDEAFPWASLFRGFPRFSKDPQTLTIEASCVPESFGLSLRHFHAHRSERITPKVDEAGGIGTTTLTDTLEPVLQSTSRLGHKVWTLKSMRHHESSGVFARLLELPDQFCSCHYLGPSVSVQTESLGFLWDQVALTDLEETVVKALHIVDPGVRKVTMIGGEGQQHPRMAMVSSNTFDRPVPLRSYGDGVNRLFGIILSLVNAKGGLLLIDEFENGLHHTVQETIWKAIFRLANQLDVQVFATSHSYDAIKAFQAAANESPEDGVLIRLTRKGEDIIPTVLFEKDLAIATESGIEVR